ncbi:hypothetical protein J5N97_017505 [Dioscorea zingiberensis]|uniref:Uncharacterized protein n=1 Tax=Dioscorea zingiberensis TaxID=325984 RepID=A0A9D5HGF7_9LILI|nr:hypothetical protein J5N97_017505 [Dioscorea zingiberensis]
MAVLVGRSRRWCGRVLGGKNKELVTKADVSQRGENWPGEAGPWAVSWSRLGELVSGEEQWPELVGLARLGAGKGEEGGESGRRALPGAEVDSATGRAGFDGSSSELGVVKPQDVVLSPLLHLPSSSFSPISLYPRPPPAEFPASQPQSSPRRSSAPYRPSVQPQWPTSCAPPLLGPPTPLAAHSTAARQTSSANSESCSARSCASSASPHASRRRVVRVTPSQSRSGLSLTGADPDEQRQPELPLAERALASPSACGALATQLRSSVISVDADE